MYMKRSDKSDVKFAAGWILFFAALFLFAMSPLIIRWVQTLTLQRPAYGTYHKEGNYFAAVGKSIDDIIKNKDFIIRNTEEEKKADLKLFYPQIPPANGNLIFTRLCYSFDENEFKYENEELQYSFIDDDSAKCELMSILISSHPGDYDGDILEAVRKDRIKEAGNGYLYEADNEGIIEKDGVKYYVVENHMGASYDVTFFLENKYKIRLRLGYLHDPAYGGLTREEKADIVIDLVSLIEFKEM